jgi:hypothetical protein
MQFGIVLNDIYEPSVPITTYSLVSSVLAKLNVNDANIVKELQHLLIDTGILSTRSGFHIHSVRAWLMFFL